ncbi:MAG: CDGSH iron-sulfur domain-containing protein [Candidatus Competibacteraceae bacterium]
MSDKVFDYPGEKISIRYEVKRCIHAAECARNLPAVFDPQRKPWVDPNAATAEAVAAVVERCPTGALHFTRHDGGTAEAVPEQNRITVGADGPLWLRGDLEIIGSDGTVTLKDTRLALCRCGASHNKPFCDGNHTKIEFQDPGALGKNAVKMVESAEEEHTLRITPAADGPLAVKGKAEIVSADSQTCYRGNRMYLCRCGASQNKPFCDGSHATVGFHSDG